MFLFSYAKDIKKTFSAILLLFVNMKIPASNPEEYIQQIPEERISIFQELRQTISDNIPQGFEEGMQYGMISFVVPKSIYPAGYHCKPYPALPFVSIASQKNFIAFYHMGIYADPKLHAWFVEEYAKHCKYKLDMGKSCVRFKRMDDIPLELIGDLLKKTTTDDWIATYEANYKK